MWLIDKVARPAFHEITFPMMRRHLRRNIELKDRYAGSRCFVICTGTSVREVDFDRLRGEAVITCNHLWMHPKFSALDRVVAYFVIEPASSFRLYYQWCVKNDYWPIEYKDAKGPYDVLFDISRGVAAKPGMPVILNAIDVAFTARRRTFAVNERYYVRARTTLSRTAVPDFDMAGNFTFLDGSVFAMLGGALYMGFKEIYLVGAGYTYAPFQTGHFYEDWSATSEGEVPSGHRKVKASAEAVGARILNIVPEGFQSPIYEAVAAKDVFPAT